MLRSVSDWRNLHIAGADGELGSVHDVYFDDREWIVRYFVVDTGRWLPGRKVLIAPAAVTNVDWDERQLALTLTREQIRHAPDVDTDKPVSRQLESALVDYYAWPVWWDAYQYAGSGGATWAGSPVAAAPLEERHNDRSPMRGEAPGGRGDRHLRSAREVSGYTLAARDGDIGHVEDFLIDDQEFAVRYMVVDTKDWLPGRHVLVAPLWVRSVDWDNQRVHVNLDRRAVENSPEFDPRQRVDRDYELRLHEHYQAPGYWH